MYLPNISVKKRHAIRTSKAFRFIQHGNFKDTSQPCDISSEPAMPFQLSPKNKHKT